MASSLISLLIAGLFARLCTAQASGWIQGQVNTTMCYWQAPRAAVIRDTLYIDGGYLWWQPGMADGTYGPQINDGNPEGLVYLLNFSTPFNTTPSFNLTNAFTTKSKAAGGSEANNIGPLYYDGAMFANDFEWFTYGGLLSLTDAYPTPADNSVAAYEAYASGPPKQFGEGYVLEQLPNGITRYVTDGAAVSVPSENLGFYFGGLRSATFGPIYYDPGSANASLNADTLSTTLIELDMTVQQKETWSNYTLPTSVPGRANAEVVWVPVSKQGILVAIGGVIYPSYANVNQTDNAEQTAESEQQSPSFMSKVAVYDIADQVWYEQETSGGAPGQLTQGCTVLASAQDGSSHNIYWYGGFNGLDQAGTFNDDVWILSVPSFMWMKVYSGTPSHARAGHKCTKPYPDQMFVIGGTASLSGLTPTCVDGGIIQIYNLSSNSWIESYDPKVWSNYTVPSMIYTMIGGTGTGSATQTAPSPSITSNATMVALFQDQYNTSKITTYYPYTESPTPANNRTILPSVVAKSSGTPKFLAPVLGVILGLVFITCLVVAIMLYRRRKILQASGRTQSENGTMDNRRWVTSWLRGTPVDAKAPTVTSDESPTSPYDEDRPYMPPMPTEIGGGQVHEMMDTSRPSELQDSGTGFTHLSKLSNGGGARGLTSSPSVGSQTSQTSTISSISPHNVRPSISPMNPPSPNEARIASGVSGVSEIDRGHLRGISETSGVSGSTDGAYATPMEGRPSAVSPITPPQARDEGEDYIGTTGSPGSNRRSNFSEELDEAGKR